MAGNARSATQLVHMIDCEMHKARLFVAVAVGRRQEKKIGLERVKGIEPSS
jgi:hypothetical protein